MSSEKIKELILIFYLYYPPKNSNIMLYYSIDDIDKRKKEVLENIIKIMSYSKLENSKLFKFYEKFNEVTNLDNAFLSFAKFEEIPNGYKEGIYKNLWNNLYRLSKYAEHFNNIQVKNDNICAYLKFWFYDRILSDGVKALDINTFLAKWEEFKKYVFQSNYCPCDFFPIKLKEIKEIKQLYDYMVFHEDLKLEGDIHEKMCNGIYLNLLKESIGIYIQKDVECSCNNNSAYCKEFNEYIKNHVNEDLKFSFKDKCVHTDPSEAHEKGDDVDVTKDTVFTELNESV
ncbi:hypothetical protein PVIIG_05326 [Plasmodium vivax India VII]|uniref:Variable surface protein Vir21 n=1 Tax=Plasmodium vivax India VII TaxID=1077284 RepID=A0A0J9S3C5_PLAVI|nr:hypothetical protein PVIIG_05326 [Plasmodium vivax India VII]